MSYLAVERNVAASTQNQAKSALLFLYKEALPVELPWLGGVTQARVPKRLPLVLTRAGVERVLGRLPSGTHQLVGGLLYGSGLRLMEALRLRVKDVEFSRGEVLVREGKGNKERVTMLPRAVAEPLQAHLHAVRELHRADLAAGFGEVSLPHTLDRKSPGAGREWGWQYVFPSPGRATDPCSGMIRQHHLQDQAFQRAFRQAARDAELVKPATPHSLGPFVRNAPARGRLRHSHRAGAAGPQRRADRDDLHPRAIPRRVRRAQSAGRRGDRGAAGNLEGPRGAG